MRRSSRRFLLLLASVALLALCFLCPFSPGSLWLGYGYAVWLDTVPPQLATVALPAPQLLAADLPAGAHTLRWYADRGRLYWITLGADGGELRVSADGDRWERLSLPADAGRPTDVLRVGERLLLMAERALLEIGPSGTAVLARVEDKKSPFALDDGYCAAPLAAFDGRIFVGDQRRGALWTLEATP